MTPTERHALYRATLDDLIRTSAAIAATAGGVAELRPDQAEKSRAALSLTRLLWSPFVQAAALFAGALLLVKYALPLL